MLGDVGFLNMGKKCTSVRETFSGVWLRLCNQNRKSSTYLLGLLKEPFLGTLGVGNGLLSGKGLGSDDEQGGLTVASLEDLGHVSTVNVGDKVGLQVPLAVVLEGLADHNGTKVGTTDTNVDDGVNGLASVTLPGARANRVGEFLHVGKDGVDLVNTGLRDLEATLISRGVSERNVQDGTALRGVNVLAVKHRVTERLDLGLTGEVKERGEDLIIDKVLGVVKEKRDVWRRRRKGL